MRVLVMGGTQFNGLALVHELVRQGYESAVCNRGRTESDIPDSSRPTGRRPHRPRATPDSARRHRMGLCARRVGVPPRRRRHHDGALPRRGHAYVFASSTVTYQSQNRPITEDDPDDRGETQIEYGLHKLLCEDRLFAAHADWGFPATTVPFSMVLGPTTR